jgi:hypothetical protein
MAGNARLGTTKTSDILAVVKNFMTRKREATDFHEYFLASSAP